MKRPQSDASLTLLITFGVLIATIGIILHYAMPERYEKIDMLPIIVGGAMAYFGALWKDPDRAAKAGEGVTHAGREIVDSVKILRTGGKNDPVVAIEKTRPVDDPNAEQTVRVTVEKPGAPSAPTATPIPPEVGPDGV